MTLQLDPGLAAELARLAEDAYPEEACGLLVGTWIGGEAVVTAVPAAANVAAGDRRRRFRLDPDGFLAVALPARDRGEEVLGVHHSHPEGGPLPSAADLAAAIPGWRQVIVAVRAGGGRPMAEPARAFLLVEAGGRRNFVEEAIRVVTAPAVLACENPAGDATRT